MSYTATIVLDFGNKAFDDKKAHEVLNTYLEAIRQVDYSAWHIIKSQRLSYHDEPSWSQQPCDPVHMPDPYTGIHEWRRDDKGWYCARCRAERS